MQLRDDVNRRIRALSVHYVTTAVLNEVLAEGLSRAACIYDMKALILRKGEGIVCPRDGKPGAAYVDCVDGHDNADRAEFMLSYTWGYEIGDIADTLSMFCEREGTLDVKRTYVWMCWACMNQHRIMQQAIHGTVKENVTNIGQIIAMMAPWRKPKYLSRVWCDLEMFTALNLGDEHCKIHIVMPPAEERDMFGVLSKGGAAFNELWETLAGVRIEDCDASVEEDKTNILSLVIEEHGGPGFHALNSAVAKHLQAWAVDTCTECLRQIHQGEDDELAAKACWGVGGLLRQVGQTARAGDVLERGRQLREYNGTMKTEAGALLLAEIGNIKYAGQEFDAALALYEEAQRVRELTDTLATKEGAILLMNMGVTKKHLKDLDGALEAYMEAKRLREITCTLETPEGSLLLNNIGKAKHLGGDTEGAIAAYEEAKAIRDRTNTLKTPSGASLTMNIGTLKGELGDLGAAQSSYEEAKRIFEVTATLDTPAGRRLLERIAYLSQFGKMPQ